MNKILGLKRLNTIYYTPPKQEIFDEIKMLARLIWIEQFDDTYGYVAEKLNRIEKMENIQDNFMQMINMFDPFRIRILMKMASKKSMMAFYDRMIDGGTTPQDLEDYFDIKI